MRLIGNIIRSVLSVVVIGLVVSSFVCSQNVVMVWGDCADYCYDWTCLITDSNTWRHIYPRSYNLGCRVVCYDKFRPDSRAAIRHVQWAMVKPGDQYSVPHYDGGLVDGDRKTGTPTYFPIYCTWGDPYDDTQLTCDGTRIHEC